MNDPGHWISRKVTTRLDDQERYARWEGEPRLCGPRSADDVIRQDHRKPFKRG